ncbi:hypothetical protein V475_05565 [Sphingobium baderi LL03]|nr:hypothetical protein V475_05565 [Sphingobium baderi LL03]
MREPCRPSRWSRKSGPGSTGRSIAAARTMGADLAYMGSPFIATEVADAVRL